MSHRQVMLDWLITLAHLLCNLHPFCYLCILRQSHITYKQIWSSLFWGSRRTFTSGLTTSSCQLNRSETPIWSALYMWLTWQPYEGFHVVQISQRTHLTILFTCYIGKTLSKLFNDNFFHQSNNVSFGWGAKRLSILKVHRKAQVCGSLLEQRFI